ncbi:type 1 fimbria pilin [Deinococcus sp. HSC-46F16]|uniref:hypothetical protein n=1 Tax=Deinococcus sp. HSC-46F16 TaxID=2910968 RepID=UPI00209EFF14|nr:hypothetical protein [Deinococcus sp. HSC-46F16]MCP2014513.1 type 1 fimbria pilin [Deinococcus sp. HSC-46F16]
MKNLTLLAAALTLAGSASAATSTGSVVFKATVANTCHIVGVQAALPASLGSGTASTASYTALNNSGVSTAAIGAVIECTKGTVVDIKATPGAQGTAATDGRSGTMKLSGTGGAFLNGAWTMAVDKVNSTSQMTGDRYGGSVTFRPDAGQWGAVKGDYSGILTVTFEYN